MASTRTCTRSAAMRRCHDQVSDGAELRVSRRQQQRRRRQSRFGGGLDRSSSSTIQNNAGAGVMLGSGNRLIESCLRDNGQYGFNAYAEDGVEGCGPARERDLRQQHR